MAKQTTPTPLAARSATAGHATIGDRIVDEMVEAIELGIDADEYCAARGASATHAEGMEIIACQVGLEQYARARQLGCAHSEAVERALC